MSLGRFTCQKQLDAYVKCISNTKVGDLVEAQVQLFPILKVLSLSIAEHITRLEPANDLGIALCEVKSHLTERLQLGCNGVRNAGYTDDGRVSSKVPRITYPLIAPLLAHPANARFQGLNWDFEMTKGTTAYEELVWIFKVLKQS